MSQATKIPNNYIPLGPAPDRVKSKTRSLERKAAKFRNRAERKIRRIQHELEAKLIPIDDEIGDMMENFREKNDLPQAAQVHTESGYVVIPYRVEGEKLMSPPADMVEFEDTEDTDDQAK